MTHRSRGRLLVVSQVYPPDPAAVGQYIADACEEIATRGWDVVVYTSARGYDDPSQRYPARETLRGVTVRRLPLSSFGKRSIPVRLVGQLLFLWQACLRALAAGQFTSLLVTTSPPFAGFLGSLLSIVKRAPFTWWVMDLNPDQMIASRKLSPTSLFARLFDWMNRVTLRQARAVIVLDRYMKDRVIAKLPAAPEISAKTHVLPPWSLDAHLSAATSKTADKPVSGATEFRRQHGIDDAFVVMYAGNHSEQNPLDTLLAAAVALAEYSRIKFVFVGGGTGKAEIDRRVRAGAMNIVSLPYQPLNCLATTLAAGDLHVVSIGDAMVGIVHPCKIYSAMAVGKPILLFGPDRCHAADIVQHQTVGWHVRHGDVPGTVAAVHEAASLDPATRTTLGSRAAEIIARDFSREGLVDRFVGLVCP
jgi:colanic acid biosynthesis glycosyl transferase WcaI